MKMEVGKYTAILPLLQKLKEEEKAKEIEEEYKEYKKCLNKGCYSKKVAQTIRNLLFRKKGRKVRIYQCDQCNFWHLTHKYKKRKNENRQKPEN
jgi:hypothetical protein